MSEISTPRTDSAWTGRLHKLDNEGEAVPIDVVPAEFARQLERELAQWKQVASELAVVAENEVNKFYIFPPIDEFEKEYASMCSKALSAYRTRHEQLP